MNQCMHEVLQVVAAHNRVDPAWIVRQIGKQGLARTRMRYQAMALAHEVLGFSKAEIAEEFGVTFSAVSPALAKYAKTDEMEYLVHLYYSKMRPNDAALSHALEFIFKEIQAGDAFNEWLRTVEEKRLDEARKAI